MKIVNWDRKSILESTKGIKNLTLWAKTYPGAVKAAKRLDLMNKIRVLISPAKIQKWTLSMCQKEARNYKSITAWQKSPTARGSYAAALKNGWIKKCSAHMKVLRQSWTPDMIVKDSRKYSTIRDWRKNSQAAYLYASRRPELYKKAIKHMTMLVKTNKWLKPDCIKEAQKYKTNKEWREKSSGSLTAALKNGWMKECTAHMTELRKSFTKKECIEIAKKYTSRRDWKKSHSRSYYYARFKKWAAECQKHMVKENSIADRWNRKTILKQALLFTKRSDWIKSTGSSYQAAIRFNMVSECQKHMDETMTGAWEKEELILEAKKYVTFLSI